MISMLTPYDGAKRTNQKISRAQFDNIFEMERSGVWDGKTFSKHLGQYFRSRGERKKNIGQGAAKSFILWTNEEWDIIIDDVRQIEDDYQFFNPHKLRIPRVGKYHIPWPWREDHAPDDVDRNYIFNEFYARFRTWDELCDEANETQESPATLYIEMICQWFKSGGKCHIFGFILSPHQRSFAMYSFGRGIAIYDENGKLIRPIKAGEMMRTGCTSLLPRDMHKEYDITRRTVIIESWRANSLRFNYSGGLSLIPLLEKCVDHLADETSWFGSIKTSLEEYATVPMAKKYKDRKAWEELIAARDVAEMDGDDDEVDEETAMVDDKVTELRNARNQTFEEDGDAQQLEEEPLIAEADASHSADWHRPKTQEEVENWAADNMAYFSEFDTPDSEKEVMLQRVRQMLGLAQEKLQADVMAGMRD